MWYMIHATADLYEKRWSLRQYMILPIQCQLSRKDKSSAGWVRDLSNIGAGVISNLTLTAGDELTFTLPKEGGPEMKLVATVRWRQGLLLGVEFKPTLRTSPLTSRKFLCHLQMIAFSSQAGGFRKPVADLRNGQ